MDQARPSRHQHGAEAVVTSGDAVRDGGAQGTAKSGFGMSRVLQDQGMEMLKI